MYFAHLGVVSLIRASKQSYWSRLVPIGLLLVTFTFFRSTEDPFHAWRWTLLSFYATAGLVICLVRRNRETLGIAPARFALPLSLLTAFILFSVLSLFPAINRAEGLWQLTQSVGWSAWFLLVLASGSGDPLFWGGVRRAAVASGLLGALFAVGQYWGLWAFIRPIYIRRLPKSAEGSIR